MPARGEGGTRERKTSKPFEGAELPRVNKNKQKSSTTAAKSVPLNKKKSQQETKPVRRRATQGPKPAKKASTGTVYVDTSN